MDTVEHRGFIIQVDDIAIWASFMAFIKEQQAKKFADGLTLPPWVFRGQSNSEWALTSSFERRFGTSRNENELVAIERQSMNWFRELSCGEVAGLSDAGLLAHMQHYGVPTRLVDFTHAPLIALYFALKDDRAEPFAVWASQSNGVNSFYDRESRLDAVCRAPMNVRQIHAPALDSTLINNSRREQIEREMFVRLISGNEEGLSLQNRIALAMYKPVNPNPRMCAQRGLFFASTKLSRPFELSYYEWKYFERKCFEREERPLSAIYKDKHVTVDYIANAYAFKFEFAAAMRVEARAYLELANVRPAVLFPDFEGVAKEVCQEMMKL